jgi:hypothetical protein
MDAIKKKYIVDENDNKIAVQIDIETYQKLEDLLENYSLVQLMKEDVSERLSVQEAKAFYEKLTKEK